MILNQEALARVYAAGLNTAVQMAALMAEDKLTGPVVDGGKIARSAVRDFVTLVRDLEAEERERVGSMPA